MNFEFWIGHRWPTIGKNLQNPSIRSPEKQWPTHPPARRRWTVYIVHYPCKPNVYLSWRARETAETPNATERWLSFSSLPSLLLCLLSLHLIPFHQWQFQLLIQVRFTSNLFISFLYSSSQDVWGLGYFSFWVLYVRFPSCIYFFLVICLESWVFSNGFLSNL